MGHYLHLQTQFGEDRCTQFRVIVVTDPQTHKQTHRQDRLQYTAPLSLARSVMMSLSGDETSLTIRIQTFRQNTRVRQAERNSVSVTRVRILTHDPIPNRYHRHHHRSIYIFIISRRFPAGLHLSNFNIDVVVFLDAKTSAERVPDCPG